jgi:hypothetical protein
MAKGELALTGKRWDSVLKWDRQRHSVTPEPGSILLFGSGILGLVGVLRRTLF